MTEHGQPRRATSKRNPAGSRARGQQAGRTGSSRRRAKHAGGEENFAGWLTGATERVLRLDAPADQLLRGYFREHKLIGRRDRGLIADRCFDILRQRRLYGHLAESGRGALARRLALLADANGKRQVLSASQAEQEWLAHIAIIDKGALPAALQYSLPDWLWQELLPVLGQAGLIALGSHLLTPAAMDLRANLLKTTRDALITQLATEGVSATSLADGDGPVPATALRVHGHPALEKTPSFLAGHYEVQDVGSQWVASVAGPRRGQTVVDFCAGAGGKTLAMAALMRSTGQIYACDTSARRMSRMTPRLARSGATNVQPLRIEDEHDRRLARLKGRADVVLVDAPCSGTGTLRRNPDLKWRHTMVQVQRLAVQQASILNAAAALVKPGGRLVYATCSLLAAENEAVASKFEAQQGNFERIDLVAAHWPSLLQPIADQSTLSRPAISSENTGFLRLWPHLDDSDGFFVAAWSLPK